MAHSSSADDKTPILETFTGQDPTSYKLWKRKALLMLASLPTTIGKEKYGAKLMQFERPAKCNTTKPGLFKQGIGFGSSLYRFTWFGVPCSDSCLLVWV